MRNLGWSVLRDGIIVLANGVRLVPNGKPTPKLSDATHEAIKRADRARADIAALARSYMFGADNSNLYDPVPENTRSEKPYRPNLA